MSTIFSYLKNSFEFLFDERKILMLFLDFFKYEIVNGNGSYLAMLNLDEINFTWCPTMLLNDKGVFGLWSLMIPNNVFIRPSADNEDFVRRLDDFTLNNKEKEEAEVIKKSKKNLIPYFKNLSINQRLIRFIFYLCECDGVVLSTVFHELYHKWQFMSAPFLYIVNVFLFSFLGYEISTKSKFSIEGDVRINVDNEVLHKKISAFYNDFYNFMYVKDKMADENPDMQILEAQLEDMKRNRYDTYCFCEKLLKNIEK